MHRVICQNAGNEVHPGVFQDIVFIVREKKHRHFRRQGSNLYYQANLTLAEALTGMRMGVVFIIWQLDCHHAPKCEVEHPTENTALSKKSIAKILHPCRLHTAHPYVGRDNARCGGGSSCKRTFGFPTQSTTFNRHIGPPELR